MHYRAAAAAAIRAGVRERRCYARPHLLGQERADMAPRFLAAYCCARKGCGGFRYVHAALANNEPLECSQCGDRFPKRTHMLPEPRRPPTGCGVAGARAQGLYKRPRERRQRSSWCC